MKTKKFLLTSDWHLDATSHGVERSIELREGLSSILKAITKFGVDTFVHLGDLCDADSPDVLRHLAIVAGFERCLHSLGVTSYWMNGNHDVNSDGTFTTMPLAAGYGASTKYIFAPTVVDSPVDDFRLMFIPYPGGISYELPLLNKPVTNVEQWVKQYLYSPANKDRKSPLLVFSHLSVMGMPVGEESKEMARGKDVTLPLAVFEKYARDTYVPVKVFQGHYHQRQVFNKNSLVPIQVVGSPARFTQLHSNQTNPGFLIYEQG